MHRALASSLPTVLLLLAGCASSGYQRASDAADRTGSYHEELIRLRAQVGLAIDALRALSENPAGSPRSNPETLQTFRLELAGLERRAERVRTLHGKADAHAEAFLTGWSTDTAALTGAELKQGAETRRKALEASYVELEQGQAALDRALAELQRELGELALYLEHDLTAAGMGSARKTIQAAFVDGALLQDQIEAQAVRAQRTAIQLAPLKELAPPPPGASRGR
ncbi:MAG TPA: hypothetical protein VF530_22085 [Planctomycetota bacterium]